MGDPSQANIIRKLPRNQFREIPEIISRIVLEDAVADVESGFVKPRRALVYMNRGTLYALLSARGVRPFGVSCPDNRGMRWIVKSWLMGGT